MKFLKLYLQPNEVIQYVAKLHYFLFLEPFCLFALSGFILYDYSAPIVKWLGMTILFLGLVSLVQRLFIKIGSRYIVTDKRVVFKTGVISRNIRELVHSRVEGLLITQSVLGRIFGYGKVIVSTGEVVNTYSFVANPLRFKMEISKCMEAYRTN